MSRAIKIKADELKILKRELKNSGSLKKYKKNLSLTLPLEAGISIDKAGSYIGVSTSQIKRYRRERLKELRDKEDVLVKPRSWGGRRRENMRFDEEVSLLRILEEEAKAGGYIDIGSIKKIYENKVGKPVYPSVITRMLSRHKWRKIAPRKYHPKRDLVEQEGFKKSLGKK